MKSKVQMFRDIVIGFLIPILMLPLMFAWVFWISTLFQQLSILNLTEVAPVIKDYASISLSIFGITLIGGIFEKNSNNDKKEFINVKGSLFVVSILFLFAFFLFQISYWCFFPSVTGDLNLIAWVLFFGFVTFTIAVFYLLIILLAYYVYRYTTIPVIFNKLFEIKKKSK